MIKTKKQLYEEYVKAIELAPDVSIDIINDTNTDVNIIAHIKDGHLTVRLINKDDNISHSNEVSAMKLDKKDAVHLEISDLGLKK